MAATVPYETPYRLQVLLPHEVREVLKEVAFKKRITLQKLVMDILIEELRLFPEGAHLASVRTDPGNEL